MRTLEAMAHSTCHRQALARVPTTLPPSGNATGLRHSHAPRLSMAVVIDLLVCQSCALIATRLPRGMQVPEALIKPAMSNVLQVLLYLRAQGQVSKSACACSHFRAPGLF